MEADDLESLDEDFDVLFDDVQDLKDENARLQGNISKVVSCIKVCKNNQQLRDCVEKILI